MKCLSYIEEARYLKVNSDISVLIVCNKTGGTIKGDIKKYQVLEFSIRFIRCYSSLLVL